MSTPPHARPTPARSGRIGFSLCRAALTLSITLTIASGLAACASRSVRPAPFRVRPDAVAAGDLRGPFQGRVVDATTGKPVAGALVYATWTIQEGYGMAHPAGHREVVTSTDADGGYEVPVLTDIPSGGTRRVTDFYLVVYKRGYVGYRSDRRFSDLGPRRDFAQTNHRIELERWRSDYSHARHLRYVGGGPAIAALTAWEAEAASAELSGRREPGADVQPRNPGSYLIAARLLSEEDVKEITGFDGSFESGPLGDEPDTDSYSSQHLKAMGLPETYDVALRVWRDEPALARQRYAELRGSLPGVEARDEIADQSLRATEGEIFGIGFLDARRGIVALLTCGRSQCASEDMAAALGKAVHQHIQQLWPAPPVPTRAAPGPAAGASAPDDTGETGPGQEAAAPPAPGQEAGQEEPGQQAQDTAPVQAAPQGDKQ